MPSGETRLAFKNALTLGRSLFATGLIAIAMRLVLPRCLGPERFGTLSFADAFTTTVFVALGLGIDAYVRKEVSVRLSHASDFFAGALLVRAGASLLLFVGMGAAMYFMHTPPAARTLVWIFGVAQVFVVTNATLSAMLHAAGKVRGVSVLAVAAKIGWACGGLLAIATKAGLWAFGASLLTAEAMRCLVLCRLVKHHVGLTIRFDAQATRAMFRGSAPYYVTAIATTAYGALDVTLLELHAPGREVGWYSAGASIGAMTLLAAPLIDWVMTPMFARAAARSEEELVAVLRRSVELILGVTIPISLFLSLGADVWIRLLFGEAYGPAAFALRIRATMCLLTYVAIVYATTLIMLRRPWALTIISALGLIVNVALNLVLIPRALASFGDGGGGIACALSMLGTEVFVTSVMLSIIGRRVFDRRALATVGKSLVAAAVAAAVDRVALRLGPPRLVLDAVAYVATALALGVVRKEDSSSLLVLLRERSARQVEGSSSLGPQAVD